MSYAGLAPSVIILQQVSIEYSLFDSSRTGTSHLTPMWQGKEARNLHMAFYIYNVWLLTHTESQACKYIPILLTHRFPLQNILYR